MESGYVFGHSTWWSTRSPLAGTIAWTPNPKGGVLREPGATDLKRVGRIGPGKFVTSPRFAAWRCNACQIIEFSFADQIGSR